MSLSDLTTYMMHAMYLTLWLSLPPIVVASVVGVLFSLFQALTQIQEQTLTFVPKLIVVAVIVATLDAALSYISEAEMIRLRLPL